MRNILKKYKAELKLTWSIRYFNSGDISTAIELSEESLNLYPKYFDALMLLGNIYGSMNDQGNALKYYKLAISSDNSNVIAYISSINCLINLKKNKEALKLLNKGLIHYKDNIDLLFFKAYILEKLKKYDKELECADYILKIGKNEEKALFIKATVYDLQKKYECSFKCYESITKIDEKNIDALYGMVMSSKHLKNFDNASKFLEKVISLDNENGYMYCLNASFLEKLEKYDKALENINMAIELDNDYSYYYLKGLILSEMGRKDQSKKYYREGVEMALESLNSNSSENSYAFIGAFFDKLGEYDKSEEYFIKSGKISNKTDHIFKI